MFKNSKHGRPYSAEEKAAAVRVVRTLRSELGLTGERRNGSRCSGLRARVGAVVGAAGGF